MIHQSVLDRRPIVVAVAGPNGAGKTTFYNAFLRSSGLRLVNADLLAKEMQIEAYEAAVVADAIRRGLIDRGESFVFETVFSDPAGNKLSFLKRAQWEGYTVALFFIGISDPEVSRQRVAIRVAKGGHSVPQQKIVERFPRVLANLKAAIRELPAVWIYDNDNLNDPFRLIAMSEGGSFIQIEDPIPLWLQPFLPSS